MEIKVARVRVNSEPPTVDIKSKKAEAEDSGNIKLTPPSAGLEQKG